MIKLHWSKKKNTTSEADLPQAGHYYDYVIHDDYYIKTEGEYL